MKEIVFVVFIVLCAFLACYQEHQKIYNKDYKIVINSNINYLDKALPVCLQSMKNSHVDYNNLILVISGDSKESIGYEVLHTIKILTIRTKLNAFDMTAVN